MCKWWNVCIAQATELLARDRLQQQHTALKKIWKVQFNSDLVLFLKLSMHTLEESHHSMKSNKLSKIARFDIKSFTALCAAAC